MPDIFFFYLKKNFKKKKKKKKIQLQFLLPTFFINFVSYFFNHLTPTITSHRFLKMFIDQFFYLKKISSACSKSIFKNFSL